VGKIETLKQAACSCNRQKLNAWTKLLMLQAAANPNQEGRRSCGRRAGPAPPSDRTPGAVRGLGGIAPGERIWAARWRRCWEGSVVCLREREREEEG